MAGLRMAHIELPRALDDYFAFAETTPTRNGRRFVITLPFFNGAKLDRLQWWYHIGPEQERQMGEAALATFRAQATERFRRHIERWLENTRQRLHGDDPIPRIDSLVPQTALPSAGVPAHAPPATVHAPTADVSTAHPSTTAAPPDPASVTVTAAFSPAAAASAAATAPPSNIVEWPADRVANG